MLVVERVSPRHSEFCNTDERNVILHHDLVTEDEALSSISSTYKHSSHSGRGIKMMMAKVIFLLVGVDWRLDEMHVHRDRSYSGGG